MILPTNGKVVVFDDKYADVKDLLGSLCKQKIPYFYFQDEGGEDLPETPIKNVRLVFLDLELVSDSRGLEKNIVSFIGARLTRVLEPNSNYILVYWSAKEHIYRDAIDNAFNDGLSDFKPIFKISLDKAEAKSKGADAISFITDEIKSKTKDFKVLKVFSFWENIVNESSGEIINDFINFINKDEKWDDVAKHLLFKLAVAYGGKEATTASEIEQIKNSFYTLNHTFIDTLENSISKSLEGQENEFTNVISSKGDANFKSIINKKLLISEDSFFGDIPGSILFVDEDIQKEKELIQFEFDKTTKNDRIPVDKKEAVINKAEKKANEKNERLALKILSLKTNYNNILNSLLKEEDRKFHNEIIENSIKIELNISPICDYAQQKMPCCRFLPGLLIDKKYEIEKNNAFNYISDAAIHLNGIDYFLIFDFKYLYSIPVHIAKKRTSKYKLRQQLLADLQVKLGSHVNRAGVLYL